MTELDKKVQELRSLKILLEETQQEIDSIQDSIKSEMALQGVDTLTGHDWKATWKEVSSSRIDSKALKAGYPEIAMKFVKVSKTKRFSLV